MGTHPFADVVIAGAYNTTQARTLEGQDSLTVSLDAALGVLDSTGVDARDVDAVFGAQSNDLIYMLGLGPVVTSFSAQVPGIGMLLHAASMIAAGLCTTALVADGSAGHYADRSGTAPWTQSAHEFVLSYGLYTAVEFALIAQRHMELYGTTPEQLATVAATIRNNGHLNPEATYFGRGPHTAESVLATPMIADPFHLHDCAITSEGGCALLLTTRDRARDLQQAPASILGGGIDSFGAPYQHAVSWDLRSRSSDLPNGLVGRHAARRSFAMAGLAPADVDVCEFYDPFSFEIIRQFEAFEFCGEGEGGDFVMDGAIEVGGAFPVTTDGGLLSYSHPGGVAQTLQRVARGVHQVQGVCPTNQVEGAEVAMCTTGGAGALFTEVMLVGATAA